MELTSLWDEQSKPEMFDKFTPADLRLMLETFAPLQDMIRQIANNSAAPLARVIPALASAPEAKTAAPDTRIQQQLEASRAEIARLEALASEDADKLKKAADSIERQSEKIAALKQDKTQLEQQIVRAQQGAGNLQAEIDSLNKQLVQFQSPAELQTLRDDAELARNLGLELPANDQQALIAMVAVLAQKDNLERLWDNLKERCEAEKRPANNQELSLLISALGWYNHNWKLRPFRLLQPVDGASFDFEQQQKAKHQTDGETLSQIWLPGLADGAGKPLRKTLVLTR
ncbi:hypothetical protein GCM10011502_27780 [Oceanisphaera marina]|uniref:Uncharacterized protein n=2 Tax=Oceanisphaera marina TaxID=2017550 RepID=A0ABQ1IVD2_9GAMM|nr:hypothetical protein GCM10011502_27780 [Oceanisphaera marina]